MQGNFEGAADFKEIDIAFLVTQLGDLGDEAEARLINDVFVPASLDERDTLSVMKSGGLHLF